MSITATATCSARAALAGNPSDGFGGAVVSIPVRAVSAEVVAERSDRFEVQPSPTPDDTFATLDDLVAHVDAVGYGDARQLILATLRSLRRHLGADIEPVRISAGSTIPRSVGLGGSSAIVTATIRAVASLQGDAAWARRLDDAALLAAVALAAESDELGIAAGLQDRVVQAMGSPVFMDFTDPSEIVDGLIAGHYEPLPEPPGVIFVASLPTTAEPSGVTHGSLRNDFDADRGDTRRLMTDISDQGRAAAAAIRRGDVDALGAAMDATLDGRRALMVLDPRHVAMADVARSCGCHANWSGSGGSVTVLAPNDAVAEMTRRTLIADLGCSLIPVSD